MHDAQKREGDSLRWSRQGGCLSNRVPIRPGHYNQHHKLHGRQVDPDRHCRRGKQPLPSLLRCVVLFHAWGNTRFKRNNIPGAYRSMYL